MPVAHLGLTVSNIANATSFYQAALQPLGYRYVGERGDSIGFGVDDADFFLSPAGMRTQLSPTHVAFTANDCVTVGKCYAAALTAGGKPSGEPGYRQNDCGCFNAAVEDLDGNTVEFIFRKAPELAIPEPRALSTRQETSPYRDDHDVRHRSEEYIQGLASLASKVQSGARTMQDLASATSRSSNRPCAHEQRYSRSRNGSARSKSLADDTASLGTIIGAVAGAAMTFMMAQTERSNAREESSFNARARTKQAGIRRESWHGSELSRSDRHRQSVDPVRRLEESKTAMNRSARRNSDCPDAQYRSNPRRASAPQRSRTYDTSDYASMLSKQSRSGRPGTRRASTSLQDIHEHPEQSPRHPSAPHRGSRRESDDDELQRYDSGISMSSSRSHKSRDGQASTLKPVFRDPWQDSNPRSFATAARVPLPPSRSNSYATASQTPITPRAQQRRATYQGQGKESNRLADLASVAPNDSISCADVSNRQNLRESCRSSVKSDADGERTFRVPKNDGNQRSARRSMAR